MLKHWLARRLYTLPNRVWNHLPKAVRRWVYLTRGDTNWVRRADINLFDD